MKYLFTNFSFLRQIKGLEQSIKALNFQADELNNSSQQQKELVEVSIQQMNIAIDSLKYECQRSFELAQPNFVLHSSGTSHKGSKSIFEFIATNTGGDIDNVAIISENEINLKPKMIDSWKEGQEIKFKCEYETEKSYNAINISITYTASVKHKSQKTFTVPV